MASQYLYPISDGLNLSNYYTKSTVSSSGYYTYINEGVGTANDSTYLYASGIPQSFEYYSGNIASKFQVGCGPLLILPSSITVNLRAKYQPADYSGVVSVNAYLLSSGNWWDSLASSGAYNYNILASSLVSTTISSGVDFSNHTMNLYMNAANAQSYDRYGTTYLKLDFKTTAPVMYSGGQLYISAVETVVSGNTLQTKSMPISMFGGTYYQLVSDRINITNVPIAIPLDGTGYNFSVVEGPEGSITGMSGYNNYQGNYGAGDLYHSPLMVLNSGDVTRSDIFRDAFFDFHDTPSSVNNNTYTSIKSNHTLNVGTETILGVSQLHYTGQPFSAYPNYIGGNDHTLTDSYIWMRDDVIVTASSCFPSGDFSLWIGAAQLPYLSNYSLVTDTDNDLRIVYENGVLSASLLDENEGRYFVKNQNVNNSQGFLLSYTGCMNLRVLGDNGKFLDDFLSSSDEFQRFNKSNPSGTLIIRNASSSVDGTGSHFKLFEIGIVNSGISDNDLQKLSRFNLFDGIGENNNIAIPSGGTSYIKYKSYEDRLARTYSGNLFKFGDLRDNIGAVGNVYGYNIHQIDNDLGALTVTKYDAPYTDISISCHGSGQNNNYYQDGDILFSGWIDASTTNPSGLLSNNFFVRAYKDTTKTQQLTGEYGGYYMSSVSYSTSYSGGLSGSTSIPAGASNVSVKLWGAGGGGGFGRDKGAAYGGNGGGGGAYLDIAVPPGTSFNYSVGIGGSGGYGIGDTFNGSALSGTNTYIGFNSTYYNAGGGGPGQGGGDSSNSANYGVAGAYGYTTAIYVTESRNGESGFSNNDNLNHVGGSGGAGAKAGGYDYSTRGAAGVSGTYVGGLGGTPGGGGGGGFGINNTTQYTNGGKGGEGYMTVSYTVNTMIPYGGDNYEYVRYYRGKMAGGTTTLTSGLHQYIIPMSMANFYADTYFDANFSSVLNITYDKTRVRHLNWDGCDVSMYYIGNNDVNGSGYKDTLKVYSAAFISNNWSQIIVSGINKNTTAYIYGQQPMSGNLDLYLANNYVPGNMDLYIASIASGTNSVNLNMECGSIKKDVELYIASAIRESGGLNLKIIGTGGFESSFDLFLKRDVYPGVSGIVPMYIYSTAHSGVSKGTDLFTRSDGVSNFAPLVLQGLSKDSNYGAFPITLKANFDTAASVPLLLANSGGYSTGVQKIFISGAGETEGASIKAGSAPLYIGDGRSVYEKILPITLVGPSGNTSNLNLYVAGGTFVRKGLDLVIPSSTGKPGGTTTLYTHGF